MTFGEKLQKKRKEKGWTQEQLAAQIGVSRQALSNWELDTAVPDTKNVLQLSKLFGVTTDYLLNDDYESDDDLPAVHASNERISSMYRNKARVIIGVCIAGVAALGLLIIGILSSVFPAVHIEAPVGANWVRATDGLWGFLKVNNLEWLFILCIFVLIAGLIVIWYPAVRNIGRKFRRKKKDKSEE